MASAYISDLINFVASVVASYHCYSNFLLYIVHNCNSICKLTMAQELPKHVFSKIEKSCSLHQDLINIRKHTRKQNRRHYSISCSRKNDEIFW